MNIPEESIVRSRSAALPDSEREAATEALLLAIRSVGLPAPEREHHFAWCCEHPKALHKQAVGTALLARCGGCWAEADPSYYHKARYHAYRHDRNWRLDLAWPDYLLAVEVDGGVYTGGRHVSGAGYEADIAKLNAATLAGYRVLRCTPRHIENGDALEWIERALGRGKWAART